MSTISVTEEEGWRNWRGPAFHSVARLGSRNPLCKGSADLEASPPEWNILRFGRWGDPQTQGEQELVLRRLLLLQWRKGGTVVCGSVFHPDIGRGGRKTNLAYMLGTGRPLE